MITLNSEQLNEVKQWMSLGHSKKEICKIYGLNYSQICYLHRKFSMNKIGRGSGRYRLSPETVDGIVRELKDKTKRHYLIADTYQVHPCTVSAIAKKHGLMTRDGHRRGGKYQHADLASIFGDL